MYRHVISNLWNSRVERNFMVTVTLKGACDMIALDKPGG